MARDWRKLTASTTLFTLLAILAIKDKGAFKMTFDEVIDLLKKNYKIAKKYEYVNKPLSWALYHTWDEVDKKEKRRKSNNEQYSEKN